MFLGVGAFGSICRPSLPEVKANLKHCSVRPTGGVAFVLLLFFLHLNPHHGKSFRQHVSEFDFLGLVLVLAGVICLLLGFNESETACKLSSFYALIFYNLKNKI
jgi:hypothetical protein